MYTVVFYISCTIFFLFLQAKQLDNIICINLGLQTAVYTHVNDSFAHKNSKYLEKDYITLQYIDT